ncbi:MAG: OmpA family protein [Brevundimonas sp.]|nr:MAG: OmpA family protein [Brevundimonas sp.]
MTTSGYARNHADMVWRAFAILLTFMCLCRAAPAAAQDSGRVCFDPGTVLLTPEGYVEVRRIAAEMSAGPPFRNHLILRRPTGTGATGALIDDRLEELSLELARAGAGFGEVRPGDGGSGDADCLNVEIDRSQMYAALWHFHGPYFDLGDAAVSAVGRRSMRAIVAQYTPGVVKYCIEAHTDTSGDPEANMELSRRRAENVALELVRQGVRWEDTHLRWYGETRLARPTADGVAEPLNRRVTVELHTGCAPAR